MKDLPILLGLPVLAAIIFLSALIVFYSLGFWLRRSGRFSDQLFEMLIIFSSIPQNAQALGTKLIMFTVLPAGFISLMPVSLIHHFNRFEFLGFLGAVIVYAVLAIFVFNAGIRQYISAHSDS